MSYESARRLFQLLALMSMSPVGYATNSAIAADVPLVTIRSLRKAPEIWDGKRVRITGWATRDFENMNLYASRGDACGSLNNAEVIGAITEDVLDRRTMRRGVFEGTFNNFYGVMHDGEIIVSTGHAAPGPLEKLTVIRWLSRSKPACRK